MTVAGAGTDQGSRSRGAGAKSAAAYRTISEVSEELDVPQHVLRFWETRFSQVRPLKRGGGRRYYRPEDVQLLRHIQKLLYEDGYTIKGVQRLLREGRASAADEGDEAEAAPSLFSQPEPSPDAVAAETPAPADAAPTEPEGEAAGTPRMSPQLRAELSSLLAELKALRGLLRR